MKRIFFSALIVWPVFSDAQLPKQFFPIANQYFISLPYHFRFSDWLDSIQKNTSVKTDSLFSPDSVRNIYFRGYLTSRSTVFPKSDSIVIIVGSLKSSSRKTVNGSIVDENVQTIFYLTQIFYFSKDSLTSNEWNALIKNTTKTLKKFFIPMYPKINSTNKFEMIWFQNYGEFPPVIQMGYGESEKNKKYYYISLQLNFSILPSANN